MRHGFLEHQYNSLLNLKFKRRTKPVSFADDLILAIRGETVIEVENFSNLELSKLTAWPKSNKISFNEERSKIMLTSRRKQKKVKVIKVYLLNKPSEQVTTMKCLGIIMDNKFKFSEHISYVAERCTKLIQFIQISKRVMGAEI